MKAFRNGLDKFMEILCSTILAAMVLIVLYQVFARKVLNNPNTVTEELVRFGLVWVAMLASAYVVGKKSHLCVTSHHDLWRLAGFSCDNGANFAFIIDPYGLCVFIGSSIGSHHAFI